MIDHQPASNGRHLNGRYGKINASDKARRRQADIIGNGQWCHRHLVAR